MRAALAVMLAAALVAACGKRGDPRPPAPEAGAETPPAETAE